MPTHHRIIVPDPVKVVLQKQAEFIAENATRPVALKWLSVIFAVKKNEVRILRVKHSAQQI